MTDEQSTEVLPEEIPLEQSGENESLIIVLDELQKSPSQFAQTIINEIKALQSKYVLLRLDRDNWRKDYEAERLLSDKLHDCLYAFKIETAGDFEEAKKREIVLHEYSLKRRGLL